MHEVQREQSKPSSGAVEEWRRRWLEDDDAEGATREGAVRRLLEQLRGDHKGSRPTDLRGICLRGADLSGLDLSGVDLSDSDLTGVDLSGACLVKASLQRANLSGACLRTAELAGANLAAALLERADLTQAGLGMTTLTGAHLFEASLEHASLSMADLSGADLRCAELVGVRMREAKLFDADLTGAILRQADLEGCRVDGANFSEADLKSARLCGLQGYEAAKWIGVDIRDVNFTGAYLLRRFVMDQNFLEEFRTRNRFSRGVYMLWWLTSDCGRSLTRWCAWTLGLMVLFAWFYSMAGVDYGSYPTWLSPIYFSVVTLTTLGYGDVLPATVGAQAIVMAQVIAGYVMLGGLLSIFSNRMTRRAD